MKLLRRAFFAGLVVVIPVLLLYELLATMARALDWFARSYWERALSALGLWMPETGVAALSIATTLAFVTLIGLSLHTWLGRWVIGWLHGRADGIPGLRTVQKAAAQAVSTVESEHGEVRKHFVLVEQPAGFWSPAFVTGRIRWAADGGKTRTWFTCYAPGNFLYSGRSFLAPPDKVRFLDMGVEDGIAAVLSCGHTLIETLPKARILPPPEFPEEGAPILGQPAPDPQTPTPDPQTPAPDPQAPQ